MQQSLASVLSQELQATDIIIVDDASQSDYSPMLEKVSKEAIRYFRLDQKMGANFARNYAVAKATGDIIAFLDDDDLWLPEYLGVHISQYKAHPNASAQVSGVRIMGSQKCNINPNKTVTPASLREGNKFCGMSGFTAKLNILKQFPFDNTLQNGQDWDLYVRMVSMHKLIINNQLAIFEYRKNTPQGISALTKRMRVEDSDARLASAYKHREWLGEQHFKIRVADQLLTFLPQKPDKLKWLCKSIKIAGIRITLLTLVQKLFRKGQ